MEENGEFWQRIGKFNNTIMAIGSRSSGYRAKYSLSTDDGLTWRPVNANIYDFDVPVTGIVANERGYFSMSGGTLFKANLGGGGWSVTQTVATLGGAWSSLALNSTSDRYVAVGSSGSVTYSQGVLNWINAAYSIGRSDYLHNIRYMDSAGQYVALGQDGYIYLSPDGITWEIIRVSTRTWRDIADNGSNKYVLMGSDVNGGNYYSTSEGGLTNWHEPVNMPVGGASRKNFTRMVYGNGIFVAADLYNEWVAIGTFIE